jgi:hypothetical protein
MNDQPALVKRLEAKVEETLRDQKLLAFATDLEQSAVTEYLEFSKDPQVTAGIKYTVLHYLASKQGYYQDPREQAEMLGVVAAAMNTLVPTQAIQGIQDLRHRYPLLYQLDPLSFDRAESSAVEFISRLPAHQQTQTIADSKGIDLQPRSLAPLVPPVAKVTAPQLPPALPLAASKAPSNINPINIPPDYPPANANNNKGALLIGSGIIAGAIIFSAAILGSRPPQNETTSSPNPTGSNPIGSNPTISTASSSSVAQNPPENVISEYYQNINNRQYQAAWDKLPESLRNSREVHPNGYQSFVDFFDKLNGIQVNNLSVSDRTDYSTIVNADLVCQSKNGNSSLLFLRFSLYRNDINQPWQISKVRLNPGRPSACGV